ncbi:hypothetical protein [Pannonibacter sp. SL95]|uniref:hypothetical protein n=1 Tax=Pannonibacter sp. SL95 TaxID=2995153 RepID=UPI0022739B15|nr:hypothetical protein [Pannonibacter sp. SL95]MCY1707664.1 hypothetical protein [Pannonibacter sp. SL95]
MLRHVIFIPGYDLRRPSFLQSTMAEEAEAMGRIRGVDAELSGFADGQGPGGASATWRGRAAWPEGETRTIFHLLGWRDLAKRDFQRSWPKRMLGAFASFAGFARSGGYIDSFRRHWPNGIFHVYPVLLLLIYLMLLCAPAVMLEPVRGVVNEVGLPQLVAWPVWLAGWGIWAALVHGLSRLIEPSTYFWYLVNDWHAIRQLAFDRDADMTGRITHFASKILQVEREAVADDDILLCAHSSGAFVLVMALAKALEQKPDLGVARGGIALATLGSAIGYIGGYHAGGAFERAVARVGAAPGIDWSDIYVPQDALCCGRANPVADYGRRWSATPMLAPRSYSGRAPDAMGRDRFNHLRWHFFALHFCYFFASQREDTFDFHRLTLGPNPAREMLVAWAPERERQRAVVMPE